MLIGNHLNPEAMNVQISREDLGGGFFLLQTTRTKNKEQRTKNKEQRTKK